MPGQSGAQAASPSLATRPDGIIVDGDIYRQVTTYIIFDRAQTRDDAHLDSAAIACT